MADASKNAELSMNGWTAVPRSFKKSLADVNKNKQAELSVSDANPPSTDIAQKVQDFAKQQLPEKTFNHSMRVWYYGSAIVQAHFPHLSPLLETYYLTCLLHDLGTTVENTHGTHMSFEYYGAFKALNFLRDNGASLDQAEAVSEAIIRHADLGETGTLTSLGMLIQLSTVFGMLPFFVLPL
ncbi:cyanamide hydratase [Ophiobolus disseminans]|uniref:Cyanamide hydratase n=1 Tax=Ophiobolus disseminans TaxID=1469910 RepID=A0A6A7A8P0_9PLEO|nr:cyanamide hydratase [Ophiobolus disseminans]